MDVFHAVRIKALKSVLKPDGDYFLRHIFRWYSETFNVPISEVDTHDVVEILTHYYERYFESLELEERLEAAQEIALDEDEKQLREKNKDKDEADDELFFREAQEKALKVKKPEFTEEQKAFIDAFKPKMPEPPEIKMDFDEDGQSVGPPPKIK